MTKTGKYRYELASSRLPKITCPHCGERKYWQRYIDKETGQPLPDRFGRCDHENQCGEWVRPEGETTGQRPAPIKKEYTITQKHETIDPDTLYFTEIFPYAKGDDFKGVLCYHSINTLMERLNTYTGIKKDEAPAILKGIYKGGTAGRYCIKPAPFVFFDVDVKELSNPHLLNKEANNLVFQHLQAFSVLVWRSNSGKGMAGIFHVPQMAKEKDTARHLEISEQVYKMASKILKERTGYNVDFDRAQGKFRQIRYLAQQLKKREINPSYLPDGVIENEPIATIEQSKVQPFNCLKKGKKEQPHNWNNTIEELENYFSNIELPTQPVKLNRCSTITDCSLFIESHFEAVKGKNGSGIFLPYLNRLQELKQVLTINSN